MFKTILSISFLLLFLNAPAQVSKIDIPMKKGKVYYEKNYELSPGLQQQELYKRVLKWFKQDAQSAKKITTSSDKNTGEIIGTGLFKIVTGSTGNYYLVRFVIDIKVHKGGYTFSASGFYEKPIESGISNEYSKIEYRWWDYRQGKPWSAEDETLFKGITADENALMSSLEDKMKI
ncbi:MAG: hypothetical protein JWQ84_1518 [Mucilaginibacter sp.]|nr:hypothetical protein [Mucilaginibacter sp.]